MAMNILRPGKRILTLGDMGTMQIFSKQKTDIPRAEFDALMWLYNHTDGPNWTDNTGWGTDPIANNWYGVTVSGGHVTQLDLHSNGLNGDISSWAVDALVSLGILSLHNTSVSGNISGWTLPASLTYLSLYNTSVSGDISSWTLPASLGTLNLRSTSVGGNISSWTLPASLIYLSLYNTSVSGDISSWTLPASLGTLRLYNTSVNNAPVMTSAAALRDFQYHNCALVQADVDAVLLALYNRRVAFTYATPVLTIGGTNAAPGGTYQDGDPPTTGKEYVYELCNDPESEGFNTWTITYNNDGGGDITRP